ncbi:MAG: cation diffusion facilitator family transporter [Pyrinomonadaceae bacterium]
MGSVHGHPEISAAGKSKKKLILVFGLTATYLIIEVVGGLLTGSLALLADAGHMMTDVAGLALALLAIWFAEKPATPKRTYGYYRFEILAALTNAVILIVISVFILYEAYERFLNPPEVKSDTMLVIAIIGLVINLIGIWLLYDSSKQSLNMKGAYFEVFSDMLTSIGVIVAGLIMMVTDWYYVDPLLSAGIGLFILPRTWKLLMSAVNILLEGTPSDVSIAQLRQTLEKTEGVIEIHDLHVWSLTSGVNAMSVHAVLSDDSEHDEILKRVHDKCVSDFKFFHITVQTERGDFAAHETHL